MIGADAAAGSAHVDVSTVHGPEGAVDAVAVAGDVGGAVAGGVERGADGLVDGEPDGAGAELGADATVAGVEELEHPATRPADTASTTTMRIVTPVVLLLRRPRLVVPSITPPGTGFDWRRMVRSLTFPSMATQRTDGRREMYDFTGRWVAIAHKALRAEFDRRLGEAGGSLSTWQVLRAANSRDAPSQIELARTLGIKGSTLVRHLDRMAADDLIERRREATDRRVLRIHITRAGEELLRRLTSVAAHSERAIAALLPPAELDAMRHSLRVIAEHFGAADAHVAASDRVAS
ncbi:MAG: hypothetical protein JWM12_2113 [Ilumatobacteraceae bacterium]|nr:hypothetical protein [Ilumatobacteraceae bacterium]